MSEPEVIRLNGGKAYPKDTKPGFISYTWLKADGSVIDMTSGVWTGEGKAGAIDGTAAANLGTGSVVIDTAAAEATYSFVADDFKNIGVFRLIIWVGNTIIRYGSVIFEWEVSDAPGDDPTV